MSKTRFLKTKMLFIALLLLNAGVFAQVKTITGVIKDDAGKPVPNASITAKGADKSALSKNDGTFSITVPEITPTITITSVGFTDKIVSIKGKTSISITLETEVKKLEDVVVNVGYQTQKVKDVTGAVSQVKGDAIKNLPTQDVATALQGRVAGVEVIAPSGQPGATSQITIRGVSSLNNTNPLYVIDGVEQPNGNNVNPQDIESISVLKDAAAAAIYGASAAGGVIIITTKKGKGSQPTVSFGSRYGTTTPRLIPLLNGKDFLTYEKAINGGYFSAPVYASEIDTLTYVDWEKELYRNGSEQNYYLSLSGSTPNINYYLSGIYNDQVGVFLDNESALAGVRLNSDVKISNAIKFTEQMNVWQRTTTPVKTPVVNTPFETQPLFTGPAYTSTPGGTYGQYPFPYEGINPVAQIKSANFDFPENNFQGQVSLEIKLPVRYLTFTSRFGYTSQTYQNNLFESTLLSNGHQAVNSDGSLQNDLYINKGSYQQTLNAYILSYDHSWGKHTINLLGGFEQYTNQTQSLPVNFTNVLGTSYGAIPSSLTVVTTGAGGSNSSSYDPNGLVQSQFGRIHYNYNNRYDFEFLGRQDANYTTFGANRHSGVFTGISGAWNINEERFYKKFRSIIGALKLRGGYGQLGNSAIGTYDYISTYNSAIVQSFSSGSTSYTSGYTQRGLPNNNLQWESTNETNIGLDGEALNGKLNFSIDWYNKTTTHLLYNVPISLSSGIYPSSSVNGDPSLGQLTSGTYLENIGSVRNRGLDIAVGYKNKAGQFNYSVNATGTFNNNKVTSLDGVPPFTDGTNGYPYGNINPWSGNALTITEVGQPFGQFYGLKANGIYKENDPRLANAPTVNGHKPQAGDLVFYDRNHDDSITAADDTIIGNPYPKFTFGINFNASWKNFDISLLFNGALGVQLYNGVTPYELENNDNSNVTSKVFQTSGFTVNGKANGVTQYPRIYDYTLFEQDPYGNYTHPSSYFVENGNYIKLKNIQIGYTLSTKLLQRVKIKTLRVYVMANNVFAITKYSGVDPELGSQFSSLSVASSGAVTGNADGSPSANHGGVTNRGIDSPAKYPSVKLFAAGLDLTF
jgi:TonB-linked SusC/RagA family outer membrane protein